MSDAEGNRAYGKKSFKRSKSHFADRVTADCRDGWPVEAGRYRLVVSRACPWASRAVISRRLLGLEDALSMAIADPIQDDGAGGSPSTRTARTPYSASASSARRTRPGSRALRAASACPRWWTCRPAVW